MKLTQDKSFQENTWGLKKVDSIKSRDDLLTGFFGVIGWGGNSGFHALNLAVQFGANPIILVGYDMRLDYGIHWHGPHTEPLLSNPSDGNVERWRTAIDRNSHLIAALGITVVNASPVSKLRNYLRMSLVDALASDPAKLKELNRHVQRKHT